MLFLGALALGVAVRAVDFLNCRSLGLDEARLAVNVASRPLLALLQPLDLDQSAPPLFLWGERLAFLLLGQGDCGLRLIPVLAGTAAGLLTYPLAARFLDEAGARLAAMLAVFSPLLITYANAVKQYSVELLAAVVLLLFFERELRRDRPPAGPTIAIGAVAPWLSLSSVFVLTAAWLVLAARAVRREAGAARLALLSAAAWAASGAIAYVVVYRTAAGSPYLRRFWELAFLDPTRPGFAGHAWKTLEDQVWGFVAGDPLVERRPYLLLLHLGTVLVLLLIALGCRRVLRTRGRVACWWLVGPVLPTLAASALGLFPIAPRLTLYLLPGFLVLFVAGLVELITVGGQQSVPPRRLAIAGAVLVLPLASMAILRSFSLEPSGHFQRLVRELREHRRPGEPVYVFARSLPPWIYYTTDWADPDTARLRSLLAAAHSTGFAFENAPSRGRLGPEYVRAVTAGDTVSGELLGLPSGMEWREVQEHVRARPDTGWVELERSRIEGAATPGVWVIATAYYAAEAELFRALERDAARRTYALLRGGSALVRYEFEPAAAARQSGSPDSLGRRRTTTSAGR